MLLLFISFKNLLSWIDEVFKDQTIAIIESGDLADEGGILTA